MMVDEADIDLVGGSSTQSGGGGRGVKRPAESPSPTPPRPSKRKAGPLSRDICIRRPFSPASSPPPLSPISPSQMSPSSPQPSPAALELPTRPDSPLPGATLPVLYSSTVSSVDSEDESGPLVIAEFDDDAPPESRSVLVNGKTPSSPMDKAPEIFPSNTLPNVQALVPDDDSGPEMPLLMPVSAVRLANGDAKGLLSCIF